MYHKVHKHAATHFMLVSNGGGNGHCPVISRSVQKPGMTLANFAKARPLPPFMFCFVSHVTVLILSQLLYAVSARMRSYSSATNGRFHPSIFFVLTGVPHSNPWMFSFPVFT